MERQKQSHCHSFHGIPQFSLAEGPCAWLCRVVARGDVANYVADAVYSTNSSLLLLLWFVIPHNAATQPELIILTKYTDSRDSHRHQPPSRAQPIC